MPAMPLWAAVALLYVANLFSSPFTAARAALMPEILAGDAYVTGNGLGNITNQLNQIVGFLVGGVVVMAVGPAAALVVDSGTFVVSALLIGVGVARRPAPVAAAPARLLADTWAGIRHVFSDPWLRGCLLLVWLASAFAFAPGAIAYPYVRYLGGGPGKAGLLLAAPCVGCTVGALVLTRLVRPRVRDRLLVPAAVVACSALLPVVLAPPLPVVLCLLAASGSGAAFAVPLNAIFVRRVAPELRARAMAVAISGLMAAQGLGFVLAGAAVQAGLAPPAVVGLCGAVGAPLVLVTGLTWRRSPMESADGLCVATSAIQDRASHGTSRPQ
jgi:Na+/melibiose symporter-like transporter